MTTKLQVFNGAIIEIGHRRIEDTGAVDEVADDIRAVYDQVVEECLAAGSWNFAMETVKLDADTGVPVNFGYTEVFAKPPDWVRTHGISLDERFTMPLFHYYDDVNYFSADSTPIYLRYVSDDTGLGLELNRWPASFTRYVQLELAARISNRPTSSSSLRAEILKLRDKARTTALNHDAMNEAQPKWLPDSAWTLARGGRSRRNDRNPTGSLTG